MRRTASSSQATRKLRSACVFRDAWPDSTLRGHEHPWLAMMPPGADGETHAKQTVQVTRRRGRTNAKSPDFVSCDVKLQLGATSGGTLFAHLIKHFLFIRGLLPAPYDVVQEELAASRHQVRLTMRGRGCSVRLSGL